MDYHSAFSGMKVVDLSGGVAGPSCAMMLAQHGADVIKVETPHNGGDWSRILGRTYQDHSAFSLYGTLGKRSLALDLKTDEGKEILWRLIRGADVFIEGFKPGTIQRYGFGYDAVSAKEPGIIYYSISGFGQTGPLAARPAMDPVLQAFTGIVTENKGEHDGHPHRIAISLIDMFSGLLGFQAIATSLYVRREQEVKKGRFIELSLMQGGAMLSVIRMIANYLERGVTQRTSMPNGVFNSADGQINITMVRPTDWRPFCEAIEEVQLLDDPRFSTHPARAANLDELYTELRPMFAARTTAWLSERLTAKGIMNGRVNSYEEFLQEEQVAATGIMSWLAQPGLPELVPMPNIPGLPPFESGTKRAHAPTLGEHTREILAGHGYSAAEIAALYEKKVVAGGK
ncbi:MAG TPA: CoA transferase [Acetobacteraceae bacterium]|jgi:crotonobetainyl-CoA:carnitine CoA-transferase CaiB-like acyl-CoA transferase|nr:CoA transferase [Acetobacteraceae bacterium]